MPLLRHISNDAENANEMRSEKDPSSQKAVTSDLDKSNGKEDRLSRGSAQKEWEESNVEI